ncbi:hypothetical protein ACJMK2_016452 [Sinanodonta woodiana]|uniref:IRS-type PTB domain-containing protein n=1 Tax=Sinanodonta woodiana TaxID=1069815 RepID=A0ABD3UUI4_SINWO
MLLDMSTGYYDKLEEEGADEIHTGCDLNLSKKRAIEELHNKKSQQFKLEKELLKIKKEIKNIDRILVQSSKESSTVYDVQIVETEASARLSLNGMYLLHVDQDSLTVKDILSDQSVYWQPYRSVKRFGVDEMNDKNIFILQVDGKSATNTDEFRFRTARAVELCEHVSHLCYMAAALRTNRISQC